MTTTTTRRAVLAGAVTLPALAATGASAGAAAADPTFAAIERHKAACSAIDELDDPSDDVVAELVDIEEDRLVDVLLCRPTTIAGLAASLRYLAAYCERQGHGMFERYYPHTPTRKAADQFLPALADRIEAMAVRS